MPLGAQALTVRRDDRRPPRLPAVQDLADVGQADPDVPAGQQHAQSRQVLLGVVPVAGGGAVRHDGADRVPVPKGVPRDLAAQGAHLAALLELRGLERPHLLAHDIGGAVALRAHLLHDRELASLALWDVVTLDPWGSEFFRLVAEHDEVFAAIPAPLHEAMVRAYIRGALARDLPETVLDDLVAPWTGPVGRSAFSRQIAALDREHTRVLHDLLPAVRCPVMVGWGAEDPWIPVEQAHRLASALPDGTSLLTLRGVGHLAPVEAPERFLDAVTAWLRAVPEV